MHLVQAHAFKSSVGNNLSNFSTESITLDK